MSDDSSDLDSKRAVVAAPDEDSNATDEDASLWDKAHKLVGKSGPIAKELAVQKLAVRSPDSSPPASPSPKKERTLSGFLIKRPAASSAPKPAAAQSSEGSGKEEKKTKREKADDDESSGGNTEPDEDLIHAAKKSKSQESDEPQKAVITGKKYSTKPMTRSTLGAFFDIGAQNLKHRTEEMAAQAHPNYNEKLTKILTEMGGVEKSNGVVHKAKAYQKAVQALKAYPKAVTSGAEAQKELDGVGKKIAKKIDEILATGSLKKLQKYHADPRQMAISLFSKIGGIGPVAAKKFVDDDGLRTLEDLKAVSHTLNHHQQIGLKYFHDLQQRVPREEVAEIELICKEAAAAVDPAYELLVAGSYRRGAVDSGDIDVLLTHPKFDQGNAKFLAPLVTRLKEKKLITDDVVFGKVKYMGVCQLPGKPHRHLDIRIFNIAHFPNAILYFTGSDLFNTQMRLIALEKGFTLNEYEVCKLSEDGTKGPPIKVKTERDIFEVLGMKYLKPEERNLG